MPAFFPKDTVQWKIEEPPAFRRLTISLWETAILAGIVVRLMRSLLLSSPTLGLVQLGLSLSFLAIVVFAAMTAHLGNFPIRQWLWRVPAFAAVESLAEVVTSALLIAVHREPNGSGRAEWVDWPAMAATTLSRRLMMLVAFAVVLSGIVYFVRHNLLSREDQEDLAAEEAVEDGTSNIRNPA